MGYRIFIKLIIDIFYPSHQLLFPHNLYVQLQRLEHPMEFILLYINYSYSFNNIFTTVLLVSKSESLNSYLMFHPNGPNFLLSYTKLWKKHVPNNNLWKFSGFLQSFIYSSVNPLRLLLKFALIPLGGSVVNLIPFYRILTGK